MALIEIDRRAFITSLGGMAAISLMSHEARADALEDYTRRGTRSPRADRTRTSRS